MSPIEPLPCEDHHRGSQRGYQQVLVLSNLRSPDTGRGGREKPNDWLGPQNGSAPPQSGNR